MKKTTTLISLGLLTSTIILPSYASAITTSGQSQSSISDTSNRNITKDSVPPASDDVKGLINDSSNEDDTSNSVEKDKMLNQKSSLNEEKTDSLTRHTENKQSTSEKSSVYSENIENTDIVTSEDISISATSQTDTSSLPLSGNGVGYSIHISNNSKTGAIIPSGTIITFNIKSDSSINIDELLSGKNTSVVNSTGSPGLFSFISASSGVITVKTNAIIYPGTANFDMYFYNIKAQYGSEEGKIEVDLSGEINFTDTSGVKQYKNFSLTPDKVYIKISKNGGGPVTLPGFVGAGADEGALPILGISNSYLQSTLNGYSLFNSEYKYNDKMYMIFRSTFVKGYTGFSRGVLWSTVDKKESLNDFKLLLNSNGAVTDITNSAGVNWTYTDNGAEADFSEWLSQNGWKISNGGNVTLYTIVPLNSISDTVQFTGSLGWDTYTKWSGTGKGMFANPSDGTRTPYFRGVGNQTIYNTDTLNPLEGINAYNGNTDISDKIKITDYDGYTVDGKNPPAGKYTLKYSVTSDSNEVAYYTRVITVLENKQSINGSDFSMHEGDKQPTVSDFKASATDKNGTSLDVMADFSKVDFKKIGTYDVVLNTIDGQSKTVKLTITENKQSINGSDFSMHEGDKQPTVSDFKASATDKNGTSLDVMADFSKVDFKKIGTYDVVLNTIDGQSKTVKLTIKNNKHTGIDHNNNKDKSNTSPGKNLLTNNSKATLPSTGEQKTNLFYVVGTMLILLPFAIYVGLKKLRRKN
ncbi:LPXTG cell wall anchor domain-containing protein [Lactococcus lactis]|uniref:LPXTG cell wall anchor domain-containing protein n=1 Tax=Lactococcus lactis TaxID=1358 RepID=UPI0032E479B4